MIINERKRIKAKKAKIIADIVAWVNRTEFLGARVRRVKAGEPFYDAVDRSRSTKDPETTNIQGVKIGGRAIYIEYVYHVKKSYSLRTLPFGKRKTSFMREMADAGALVGVAYDFADCRDIIMDYKRKKRTYLYLVEGKALNETKEGTHTNEVDNDQFRTGADAGGGGDTEDYEYNDAIPCCGPRETEREARNGDDGPPDAA